MSDFSLKLYILERWGAIRTHRDEKDIGRCWANDYPVAFMVTDTTLPVRVPENFQQALAQCERFYDLRGSTQVPVILPDAITDPAHWDDSLIGASREQLWDTLVKLQLLIKSWNEAEPSVANDERLYAGLPEKLQADFRLRDRPKFLGGTRQTAPDGSCIAHWCSHEGCDSRICDPTKPGPCTPRA